MLIHANPLQALAEREKETVALRLVTLGPRPTTMAPRVWAQQRLVSHWQNEYSVGNKYSIFSSDCPVCASTDCDHRSYRVYLLLQEEEQVSVAVRSGDSI